MQDNKTQPQTYANNIAQNTLISLPHETVTDNTRNCLAPTDRTKYLNRISRQSSKVPQTDARKVVSQQHIRLNGHKCHSKL